MSACEGKTGEEAGHNNVNLVQLRILSLYNILKSLEACGYWLVPKDDVSYLKLPVGMNEDLRLKYPRQVRLVDEIKVRGYKMLICKNPKNKNVIKRGVR